MDRLTALRVVEAAENVASTNDGYDDHARGVVASAFAEFARELSRALDVPSCTCHWYHDSHDQSCPRTAIENEG